MLRLQADTRAMWNDATTTAFRLQADVKSWELGLPAQSSLLLPIGSASFCELCVLLKPHYGTGLQEMSFAFVSACSLWTGANLFAGYNRASVPGRVD